MMKFANKILLFLMIVWRPVTGDKEDTWLQAWKKYRLRPAEAWKIANIIYE